MSILRHRIELFDRVPANSTGAELGIFEGNFTEEIASKISPKKIYAVDLFPDHAVSGDQHGKDRHSCDMKARHEELKQKWKKSPIEVTRAESAAWLWSQKKGSLDWVYIDTTHDYQHTAHELAAAHHAVRPGGWIMGHDWDMEFSGVICASSEYARRWDCKLDITTQDGLASFAMIRPDDGVTATSGIVLQVAHGSRDERLWELGGPAIRKWAESHGWRYEVQRNNPAEPMAGYWAKLATELDLLASCDDTPILTLDSDVLLRAANVSPSEAFECQGIGMAIGGQAGGYPHFNCGVRAVWGRSARLILEVAWRRRHEFSNHAWNEQGAIHATMSLFPGTVVAISPRWNHNFNDRHLQGRVDTVISGYHGTANREELMSFELAGHAT